MSEKDDRRYRNGGRERAWIGNLRLKYGLSVEDYNRMFAEQGGRCAICGSADPKAKHQTRLSVDHDHASGKVRGLLCGGCNIALGRMEDNPHFLRKAASYIEQGGWRG